LDEKLLDHASILDNRYKIIETIGEGRYAKVKLAIELDTNKQIAIKIMKNS
jgi:serine/threonine protein kinase